MGRIGGARGRFDLGGLGKRRSGYGGATAYFDFEAGAFSHPFAVARASAATLIKSDGSLQSVASDVARYSYATGKRALLLEDSATNVCTRSSHTAAYPWPMTASNGITASLAGLGATADGIAYADFALTGTASSVGSSPFLTIGITSAAAIVGDVWTASVYAQLLSGTMPAGVTLSADVSEYSSAPALLVASTAGMTLGATVARTSNTRTISDPSVATARSVVSLRGMTAGMTTFTGQTIRIFGLQLEKSAAPSSLIQSLAGAATTRAADIASVVDVSGLSLSAGYTVLVTGRMEIAGRAVAVATQLDDNTDANRGLVYYDNGAGRYVGSALVASVAQGAYNTAPTIALPASFRWAQTVGPNRFQASYNGANNADDTVASYVTPTRLRFAANVAAQRTARLLLSRVVIYPRLMTAAEINALTA